MTPCTAARQASLSITNSRSLLKCMSIESVMPSSHLILCCPLLLLPSIFSFALVRFRWPEYWRFSFSIRPSNESSRLISFRMDWLDLLAVQGSLTSFLQHHSLIASILRCSAFFVVQLSHACTTLFLVKANPGIAGHSCCPGVTPRSKVGEYSTFVKLSQCPPFHPINLTLLSSFSLSLVS